MSLTTVWQFAVVTHFMEIYWAAETFHSEIVKII